MQWSTDHAQVQATGAIMLSDDDIKGEIKYYPYRTALVSGFICRLPRTSCTDLENKLAEKAGVQPDNHVVYELRQDAYEETDPVYIWISDFSVTFAKNIVEHPNGY